VRFDPFIQLSIDPVIQYFIVHYLCSPNVTN
jgi:hypothetical protein